MSQKELLIQHYEECFKKHGDNHLGVDWPNKKDAETRYRVMAEVTCFGHGAVRHNGWQGTSVIDYGCGLGHFHNYLIENYATIIPGSRNTYYGYDPSPLFVNHCLEKVGPNFTTDLKILPVVDYTIMNGVFTERKGTMMEAWNIMLEEIKQAWSKSREGIAFNVMSCNVDYQRKDLFHVTKDGLTTWIYKNLSKHFMIREDYGLYEYTVYVYRKPSIS